MTLTYLKLATMAFAMAMCLQNSTAQDGGPCKGWIAGEESFHQHDSRCEMYFQCSENGAHLKHCLIGSLFHPDTRNCGHSKDVLAYSTGDARRCNYCQNPGNMHRFADSCNLYYECVNDIEVGLNLVPKCCAAGQRVGPNGCLPMPAGESCPGRNYTHPKSCRSYYQCQNGALTTDCCPDGQRFDETLYTCVLDDTPSPRCTEPCAGTTQIDARSNNCRDYRPVADPCRYEHVTSTGNVPKVCRSGTGWSADKCTCVKDDRCLSQVAKPCTDYNATLFSVGEWGFSDEKMKWTGNSKPAVTGNGQFGIFNGLTYLAIYHYANNVVPSFMARITVDVQGTGEQVLLSNACPRVNTGTFTLAINPSTRIVRMLTRTTTSTLDQEVVSVTYPGLAPGRVNWLQVTMRLDGSELSLNVKGINDGVDATNSAPFSGSINSACNLNIGKAQGNDATAFVGKARNVEIYRNQTDCATLPPVDF